MVREEAGAEPSHVVVLASQGAPPRSRLRRRRPRAAETEPDPAAVTTTKATVIGVAEPFADEDAARAWLALDQEDAEAEAARALGVLNRVLHLQRAAAADPYVRDVGAEQAIAARLGYGAGEQVADGRWTAALDVDLRPRRPRRVAALRPQERLAALLGGRDRALACEELVLRARLDLDEGRPREAALQVRVALEAALAELEEFRSIAEVAERLDGLRDLRAPVGHAANAALRGPLDEETREDVEEAVARVESVLRARTARGL